MRKVTDIALVFAILFTFTVRICAGADWWEGIIGSLSWSCLPYGILLFFNRIESGNSKKDIALLITTIMVSGFGMFILTDALLIHIDAQGGLIFLFLPFYQVIASILGGLIGIALDLMRVGAQQIAAADGKKLWGFR